MKIYRNAALLGISVFVVYFGLTELTAVMIRHTVNEFGTKLKQVSLDTPPAERSAAIQMSYTPYLNKKLLHTWMTAASTENILGRHNQNTWPASIEVATIRNIEPKGIFYEVTGSVVEVTSNGGDGEQIVMRTPVTLIVEKISGKFFISSVQKGEARSPQHQSSDASFQF